MDEATARFLVSNEGRDLLRRVAEMPGDAPTRVLTLRKQGIDPAQGSGAVEVVEARRRARRRFADADELFFTGESLAQATSPLIAAYHAERLAPFGTIADLCCGVGMDALAFAEAGAQVLAIDLDPARLVFAETNARVRGLADRITFQQGDVTRIDWTAPAAFFDPARRTEARQRVSRHADLYAPPLTFLDTIRERTTAACAKLSPALPDELLLGLGGRVEFLSEQRECKEACIWTGALADEEGSPAALLLPEQIVLAGAPEDMAPLADSPGAYLLDPDPAIVRAGALPTLCERVAGALLSPDDAYLTANEPGEPRLASPYRILETWKYHPRRVGEALRQRGIGRLVVKKRHFPKEPDAVARELGLNGKGEEGTLVLVREGKSFLAVLCEPVLRLP